MVDQVTLDLVKAVAGLESAVQAMVDDSKEERESARQYRASIREQLELARKTQDAARAEVAQLVFGLTALQSEVTKLAKTLGEHEGERLLKKGAWQLATASARMAWTLFGVVGAAAIA